MRGRSIGQAKFICAKCGHGVAATWRKRTKMYEGRCIHCEQWNKYLKPNTPAVPVLD
jgi:predicted ATP-dependent serine protease